MNDFRIAETGMTCWVIGIRVSKKLGGFLGVLVVTVTDFYYIGVSASMATTREVLGMRPHKFDFSVLRTFTSVVRAP